MLKINNYFCTNRLFEISCFFLIIGLFFSRAILSISLLSLFILGISSLIKESPRSLDVDIKFWLFPFLYFAYLISFFNTTDVANWSNLILKNVFLLSIPLSFKFIKPVNNRKRIFIFYIVVSFLCIVGTTLRVLLNYEAFSNLIINSKNITPINGLSHTEFGVLIVVAFILLGSFIVEEKRILQKRLLIAFAIIFLVCLHVIALRFALVTLYFIIIIYSGWVLIKEKKYILGISIIVGLLFASMLLYHSLDSFKNRIINTKSDIENIIENGNPNYKSIHQRWSAIKCALEVTKNNMWFGVSPADLSFEMENQYDKNSYLLIPENRVFIHNQFIFYVASFGIPIAVFFLISLAYVFIKEGKYNYFSVLIMTPFFLHMQIDNTLERQVVGSAMLFFFFVTGHQNEKQYL